MYDTYTISNDIPCWLLCKASSGGPYLVKSTYFLAPRSWTYPGCSLPGWWLRKNPLKNMISSVGMMKFPTEWKNDPNVPNHRQDILSG